MFPPIPEYVFGNSIPCYTSNISSMLEELRPVICLESLQKINPLDGENFKFVASRHQQNTFPRLTHYIKLLNPKIMFVEGTLLTGGVGWAIPPGTPSPIS